MTDVTDVERALARLDRDHRARLLSLLVMSLRRFDLAEDALQDAFEAAARRWPECGVPDNPPAWVLTTARRRAIDRIRTGAAEDRRLPLLIVDGRRAGVDSVDPAALAHTEGPLADERLRMLFACAHPALAPHAQVAMILRFVNGLAVSRIASLLLVPDSTVAARITRAKHRIAASGIPVVRPSSRTVEDRLDSVLTALYLAFTEGYAQPGGDARDGWGLADEAIRCTGLVHDLLHGHPRVAALLALEMLHHARRDARFSVTGRPISLEHQDRDLWHQEEIERALALIAGAPDDDEPYVLQARIAAAHCTAPRSAATDWSAIASLYARLEHLTGSPVVRLNRAVAVAEVAGPNTALEMIDGLEALLPRSHRVPTVRAELLVRLDDHAGALEALDRALALARADGEQQHLARRRAEIAASLVGSSAADEDRP